MRFWLFFWNHYKEIQGYEIPQIRQCVLMLEKLAQGLRRKRVENGSVRIEQVKIGFVWDPETKVPVGFHPYIRKESHKLIEEFMLAANIGNRLLFYPTNTMENLFITAILYLYQSKNTFSNRLKLLLKSCTRTYPKLPFWELTSRQRKKIWKS